MSQKGWQETNIGVGVLFPFQYHTPRRQGRPFDLDRNTRQYVC